jgi:hypothetical protein
LTLSVVNAALSIGKVGFDTLPPNSGAVIFIIQGIAVEGSVARFANRRGALPLHTIKRLAITLFAAISAILKFGKAAALGPIAIFRIETVGGRLACPGTDVVFAATGSEIVLSLGVHVVLTTVVPGA